MPASAAGETAAVPTGFFCEHTARSSRILVMLRRPGHAPAARTVLAGLDPQVAEEVGELLRRAAAAERDRVADVPTTAVERISRALPGEQAQALRRAVEWAAARRWPAPEDALRPLPAHDDHENGSPDAAQEAAPRLAQLPGYVVRVARLMEVHVPDPAVFLTWMREGGWEPLPAEDPDDDPDDLVGAVMSATDEVPPLMGARLVTEASHAHVLEPERGDELLDWSDVAVVVDLGAGWRHHPPNNAG
jgi:hypothetical protein